MLASEKRCNKFCDRSIEFSPITGIWIRRLQAYRWIQQLHENKVAHGGNLFRTCRCLNIASLLALTPTQVFLNVNEYMTWLEGLKKDVPKLRNKHLQEWLSSAQVREDTALVIAIQKEILRAESIIATGGQYNRQQTQLGAAQSLGSQCLIQQVTHSMPQGRV
jgi:hypothetical protein